MKHRLLSPAERWEYYTYDWAVFYVVQNKYKKSIKVKQINFKVSQTPQTDSFFRRIQIYPALIFASIINENYETSFPDF